MSRSISVAIVLLSAGVAWGQAPGDVVSFFAEVVDQEIILSSVPNGDFILTDVIMAGNSNNSKFRFVQVIDEQEEIKTQIHGDAFIVQSFGSGIRFESSSQIKFDVVANGTGPWSITLSGYIPCRLPCRSGSFPAGNAGVGVLVVLLVAGGGLVLSRRQRQAA